MKKYLLKLCAITSLFISLLVVGYSFTAYAPMTILLFVGICGHLCNIFYRTQKRKIEKLFSVCHLRRHMGILIY